jgi:hypothetical protein
MKKSLHWIMPKELNLLFKDFVDLLFIYLNILLTRSSPIKRAGINRNNVSMSDDEKIFKPDEYRNAKS